MKNQHDARKCQVAGLGDQKAFTIQANAEAFRYLSGKLYQSPITAIVRELACNAYDSHVAKGIPDKPFDVLLPTSIESTFEVRDYGTGLSHEDVLGLYTTYFGSTKSDSNEHVGCFGLGSKTPFSYTDQFTVISWHGGFKRTYSAFVGEDGVPSIAHVLEEKAKKNETGLSISFAVKNNHYDFLAFKEAAQSVFFWFDVVPNITPATKIERPNKVLKGKGFFVADNIPRLQYGGYGKKSYVLMGNVAYPLERNNDTVNYSIVNKDNIVILADIGEVMPHNSRERLQYNNSRTKDFLEKKSEYVLSQIAKEIQKKVSKKAKSYVHAAELIYESMSDGILSEIDLAKAIKFKGQNVQIRNRVYRNIKLPDCVDPKRINGWIYGGHGYSSLVDITVGLNGVLPSYRFNYFSCDYKLIVNDKGYSKGYITRLLKHNDLVFYRDSNGRSIKNKYVIVEGEIAHEFNVGGKFAWIFGTKTKPIVLSELKKPTNKGGGRKGKNKNNEPCAFISSGTNSLQELPKDQIDHEYFVAKLGQHIYWDTNKDLRRYSNNYIRKHDLGRLFDLLGYHKPVLALTPSKIEKELAKKDGARPFMDYVKSEFIKRKEELGEIISSQIISGYSAPGTALTLLRGYNRVRSLILPEFEILKEMVGSFEEEEETRSLYYHVIWDMVNTFQIKEVRGFADEQISIKSAVKQEREARISKVVQAIHKKYFAGNSYLYISSPEVERILTGAKHVQEASAAAHYYRASNNYLLGQQATRDQLGPQLVRYSCSSL